MLKRLINNSLLLLLFWVCAHTSHSQSENQINDRQTSLVDSSTVHSYVKLGHDLRLVGQHDSSLYYFSQALEYYESVQNREREADLIVEIGETYRNNDVPDRAMDYFIQAVRIYDSLQLLNPIADTYNRMADLVMRQNDYPKAEQYLSNIDELLRSSPYPPALAHRWMNQGRIYNSKFLFDSAILCHQRAIDLFDSLKMYHDKGRAMHNRANSLRELKRYDEAMELCQEALTIPELSANLKSRIFTILLIADIYRGVGQLKKSIAYGLQGLSLAETYGFLDRKRVALKYLSQVYELKHRYDSAYYYHKLYTNLMADIFDKDIYEQVNRMNTLYETEKKEQTITLQQANLEAREATIALQRSRQNQLFYGIGFSIIIGSILLIAYVQKNRTAKLLSTQKEEIEKQNKEKETLLKEIHHRVKNNLQVISSLLNMQSRKMKDSEAKVAVREGQSRIKSMSLIHQKLYSEGNLSRINMKEYMDDLCGFLFKSYKANDQILLKVESEDILLDVDTAVPLGLIINELITNALKYAFPKKIDGCISLQLINKAEGLSLEIADTGIGLPVGYDQKQSMGMRLVHILVEQLNGKLEIENKSGAVFTIHFEEKHAYRN